jgi:hypothetical protein
MAERKEGDSVFDKKPQRIFISADIGLERDYTAISTIEQRIHHKNEHLKERDKQRDTYTAHYRCTSLERLPLPTDPQTIQDYLAELALDLIARSGVYICIDNTGVGAPISWGIIKELLRRFADVERDHSYTVMPITITSGHDWRRGDRGIYYVPRDLLISAAKMVVSSGRFKASPRLPLAGVFEKELRAFQPDKRLKRLDDTEYALWREGEHDDTIFSVAMALWRGEAFVPADRIRTPTEKDFTYPLPT